MTDSHAARLAAQLREFEDDDELPAEIQERARERRQQLEEVEDA